MQRSWLLVAVLVVSACSKKTDEPRAGARGIDPRAADKAPAVAPTAPPPKIDGPSITPVKTESVTFVVPKAARWWGEFNLSCYRGAMSLSGTKSAAEPFERISPNVPSAMAAGNIDLGTDLTAFGMFDCGGTPCIYVAARLTKPEKMPEVLAKLLPGIPQQTVAPNHYTLDTPGTTGRRTIHVRVVPVQWSATPAGDAWISEAARTTHVVFIVGVDGKNVDVDPLALLADPQTALAHVKDAEGLLADARGRCLLGRVGSMDFQPGFALDRARFALAAPAGKGDPLMQLIGSQRTLDLDVELVLTPAARDADVKKWIAQGRGWMANIAAPIRAQVAGDPMLDVFIDMLALLGERGLKSQIQGKSLRFSWRTDRVPRSDLDALEARFQAVQGAQP
jgi:hypothetical protein